MNIFGALINDITSPIVTGAKIVKNAVMESNTAQTVKSAIEKTKEENLEKKINAEVDNAVTEAMIEEKVAKKLEEMGIKQKKGKKADKDVA